MPFHKGRPTCACGERWLPEYERRLAVFGITVRFTQLIGNYGPSGGTHGGGLCFDLVVVNTGGRSVADAYFIAVREARQMGAPGTWRRVRNWDGRGGIEHEHGIGEGCSHITAQAQAQLTGRQGVFNGRNGLANYGTDPGSPTPPPNRTWAQGITWARDQEKDDSDMPLNSDDLSKIKTIVEAAVDRRVGDVVPIEHPVGTPESRKANPKWFVASVLAVILREVTHLRNDVTTLVKALGQGGGSGKV